jgi:hypothetical protein
MRWRLTPTTSAAHIALEPFTAVGQSVRVDPDSGFAARVAADTSSLSAFRIVPGLGDRNGVSFELKARPGMYLHDDDGALVGAVDDETVAFKDSATFTVREDLRGEVDPRFRSFDIYKQPGRYLVELDGVLQLAETTGAQAFQDGATFRFVSRD